MGANNLMTFCRLRLMCMTNKERQADAAWVDMATARSRVSRSDRTRTLIVAPRFVSWITVNTR